MSKVYKPLFHVLISHSYYDDLKCEDFEIKPTVETQRLLSRFKLVLKKERSGLSLLHQVDEETKEPFLELEEGSTFHFSMHLKNTSFYNFTELPESPSPKSIYSFDNSNVVVASQDEDFVDYQLAIGDENVLPLSPRTVRYEYTTQGSLVKFLVYDDSGVLILNKEVQGHDGTFSDQLVLLGHPTGRYTIAVEVDGEIVNTDKIFVTDLIAFGKPFGVLSIRKDQSVGYGKTSRFHLEFPNKAVSWKYHVRLTKDYEGYGFSIVDKENYNNDETKSRYTEEIKFAQNSTNEGLSGEIVTFESGEVIEETFEPQSIPKYESPKKSLRLVLSKDEKNIALDDLPNPAVNNLKSEVYIDV
ncbi:hypothetical protein [Reichenbachiella sp.]|uniref:hypothetical protein n=1 Tax=Reichenbachiella sp. TaxID=2184521 RepID=UPI00329A4B01